MCCVIWGLPLTEPIIAAARAHWGLVDALITLAADRENRVFRVDTPGAPMALRLHRPGYRSLPELRSELDWMAMLANKGIPVPAPILALDGSSVLDVDGVIVDCLTWLDGSPMSDGTANADTYYQLGQLTARMHDCADAWTPSPDFIRPVWNFVGGQPTWNRFWDNPGLSTAQRNLLVAFRDHARGALADLRDDDHGLIHADLVPDNVLVHEGVLQPIDFDDGGFGPRLFDIATITFRSRRMDPTGTLADATVNGYRSARSQNWENLPLYEAVRACSYVGWNIPRMDEDPTGTRNARFISEAETAVRRVLQP